MINAVFIGGLTNGKIVYDYLKNNKFVNLCLTITYADDFKGARFVPFENDEFILKTGSVKNLIQRIKNIEPDVIFVAGWSEIIPAELLSVPKMGVIGFHPAKLPNDRGRSVLAWQIEDGYTETALTMLKYSDYPDGGEILAQEQIKIEESDYINNILDKVDEATYSIMRAYFPLLRQGLLKGRTQDLSQGNFRRLRGERDSLIDWNRSSKSIYDKIRAISHPYPGAFAELNGRKYRVWRSMVLKDFPLGKDVEYGTLVAKCYDNSLVVKSCDGFIRITEWEEA
ncbi:MAG: formyltransferase family protein [Spirochaetales bacterium]|nr:formyltransferase family protein [Spirochaetales bacterium]